MAGRTGARSAASRVVAVLLAAVIVVAGAVVAVLVFEGQRAVRAEAERVTRAVAETLAESDAVRSALASAADQGSATGASADARAAASDSLQPFAEGVRVEAAVDFVTIMTPDGIRVAHRDPAEVGRHYLGTIPVAPVPLTEESTGTLGPSVRTIAPVQTDGGLVGWVSVGVTVQTMSSAILSRLPVALAIALVLVAVGLGAALLAGRATRRVTGDLAPGSIRDAVSSYESLRTLGEALRAQTHEHGNRMHTAVALIEIGRTEQAVEILTETSRQSQLLVDQVAARRDGDPTVGALLLGKAAQARERGIDWIADIDPAAPRSVLSPVDAVSVVGNLIDNALDAAAAAPGPRWVRVALAPGVGLLRITVTDSGEGVPAEIAERIFERGFSTKPAGTEGRGVGLALVRSIVEHAGGSVRVTASPTAFEVELPERHR